MPLFAATLTHTALGLLAAWLASPELRGSPRAVWALRGFVALAAWAALVVTPWVFFLLARYTDWMLSYVADGTRVPSALSLVAALGNGAAALAGFALGARMVRDHQPRRPLYVAGALVAVGALGCLILRERVWMVGTAVQFRGGFGLRALGASRLSAPLTVGLLGESAAFAHLGYMLRARIPAR